METVERWYGGCGEVVWRLRRGSLRTVERCFKAVERWHRGVEKWYGGCGEMIWWL